MMRVKRIITMVMICIMLLSATACSKGNEEPEKTENDEIETAVGEFQYACQTSDVDAMLDCLDTGFAQSLKSGRLLLNWMSTAENADEIVMNTMLISIMNIADISVDLSTMNIEIDEIAIDEGRATVSGTLDLESTTGTYHDKITMRMSKDNEKWYITGVTN